MPEHYTKSTVQAEVYCNSCGKRTPWRISGGRRQFCIPCYEKPRATETKSQPAPQQASLFQQRKP